jgi:hypothetical protein
MTKAKAAKAPPKVYVEGLPHSDGKRVEVCKTEYRDNGKIALYGIVNDDEEGEQDFATFSVNLPEQANRLGKGQTYMKNWSENAGMLEVLQKAGIVGPTLFEVETGFVKAQAVQVLI